MSLIPVGFFTLIAIVGWLLSIHPPGGGGKYDHGTGNADPVDEFLKTQEEWVGVSDLVASFDYLPVAIKQGESNMIEVMIAIKHSHLRGRDRLVGEMEEFAELAGAISHKTIVWNNMVAATVDRVQNMNYHALRGLRGVQNSYSWPVIPAPASDTTGGLLTIAQGIAHRITSSLAHSQEQRVERFRVALVDEADRCGKDLGTLRVSGTELKADFARATRILKKMAEIARSEAFLTKGDRKDLEDSFWQLFGFYSGQIDNLNAHIQYLDGIAGDMMVGHRFMNDAIGRIVKLDDGFGHLQRSLKEMKFEKSSDLALRMDRIQSGIDKINKIRGSAHGAVSSGMYHQLRARIEAA